MASRVQTDYIGFRVEPDIRERLEVVSEAEERSVAYLVRTFIRAGLRAYEERGLLPTLRRKPRPEKPDQPK